MASVEIIGRGIIALQEAFPSRDVTERTVELWCKLFRNVSDEEFTRGVEAVLTDPKREFFPAPGIVMAAIHGPPPKINFVDLARLIEGMGHYNPHQGWIWPRPDDVRRRFGDAVASGYGFVGGRLGADDEVTRSIAFRDFANETDAILVRDGAKSLNGTEQPPLIGGGAPQLKLVKGDGE